MDIAGAFNVAMISVILAFLFVNMFDTAGTLMGVAHRANLVDEDGKIQNLSKALKADSTSSVVGAMVGCPPVTSYVESAAGVAAGGRTGLTAITVGMLFLAAMFFAPLAGMIPAYATAGALIYVAMLMMSGMAHIDWKDRYRHHPGHRHRGDDAADFSIANGIALGFLHLRHTQAADRSARQGIDQPVRAVRDLHHQVRLPLTAETTKPEAPALCRGFSFGLATTGNTLDHAYRRPRISSGLRVALHADEKKPAA